MSHDSSDPGTDWRFRSSAVASALCTPVLEFCFLKLAQSVPLICVICDLFPRVRVRHLANGSEKSAAASERNAISRMRINHVNARFAEQPHATTLQTTSL